MKKSLPLFQALFDKNEAKFLKLAKSGNYPFNETDPSGRRLLSNAVVAEMADAVAFLLEQQPDIEHGDEKGWTALHFASYCNNVGIAKQLLAVFPTVDVKDATGNTPLARAVIEVHLEMVAFLVKEGADPSLKNINEDSPLSLAQELEATELIKRLNS